MPRPRIHLISNAHLDPVWLWDWEEGAGEALSTFRAAANLCEEFPGYIFNHNEAVLYRWVEEFEPGLFRRIGKLVREKRWHILGGWYLQPDCNLPSGESFVRQIVLGKRYFKEKFGIDVRTASNLDSFGHTQGLVQILAKSGFDSYIFCRPGPADLTLPSEDFTWVGFDGSTVTATRITAHYNTAGGQAGKKILDWIAAHPDRELSLVLWGVGDHGGGASRADLIELGGLMKDRTDVEILHSSVDAYFEELRRRKTPLPERASDLNPWAVGCYTSMARVKQKHRRLENDLFMAEKMASAAAFQGLMKYPGDELREALLDLAFSEFHDILPGSSIQPAEESSVRRLDHGLEILSRVKARAFFALAGGEPAARDGEIPILVYNPHPFRVAGLVECEFEPYEINASGGFLFPQVYGNGRPLPSQPEKEESSLSVEWRKKVVFAAELAPGRINRFDCRLEKREVKPVPRLAETDGRILHQTGDLEMTINTRTGLVDRFAAAGLDLTAENAFQPIVMNDNADPWGMSVKSFRDLAGRFELMSDEDARRVSGITAGGARSVRIIEDGAARAVVEAVFGYGRSVIFQRYKLPKTGTQVEVELRVLWNEMDKMLKLSVPTRLSGGRYIGQVAYGAAGLPVDGTEAVAQKWVAVVSEEPDAALTCINDGTYGSDFAGGELRLSLLRSPAYSADPAAVGPLIAQDRHIPRQDQGERIFHFWFDGGRRERRLSAVDREALVRNEKPFVLAFFPPGQGKRPLPFIELSDEAVQAAAVKRAEDGRGLIIRLFEPTGKKRKTSLSLPWAKARKTVTFSPFEIRTFRFRPGAGTFEEVDLLERPVRKQR
ncbi:MAG: alpha-mannosidase [Candidatus Aminicenantes bacterium RBG_16_63_16]|nr:MAG: alpha-mannosidase [Candidatus Aminicenantes bacterium RBG_16_63_16]